MTMRNRAELDALAQPLRDRQADGEALDPAEEALGLRGSGSSVIETSYVLAQGFGMRLADVKELMVRLAASGKDNVR